MGGSWHPWRAWLAAAAVCLAAGTAVAEPSGRLDHEVRQRVVLGNGRTLDVERIEPLRTHDGAVRLHLTGGGSIAIPSRLVVRRVALAPPPPEPLDDLVDSDCDPWSDVRVARWDGLIREAAVRHGVAPSLVRSVVAVESCGDPTATSPKGAVGLMQLMPATAADYGCTDPSDPRQNVDAGCRHLAWLSETIEGGLDNVLAAYNAGHGAVLRAGGVPPYPETRKYVRKVKAHLARAKQRRGAARTGG